MPIDRFANLGLTTPFAAIGCFHAAVTLAATLDIALMWGQNLAKGDLFAQK